MSVVFHCGFARVAVKESWHKVGSSSIEIDPGERGKNYLGIFEEDSQEIFAVERSTYIRKSKAVYNSVHKHIFGCKLESSSSVTEKAAYIVKL